MRIYFKFSLSLLACIALALSACTPQPLTTPTPATVNCVAGDLVVPQALSPFGGELVDSLRPEYSWQAEYECAIHYYRVEVQSAGGTVDYVQTGPFVPDVDLETATAYQWRVAAVTWDGTVGPYSEWAAFVTGPACGDAQRWAVSLESPVEGEVVVDDNPPLAWTYPGGSCTPDGYAFTVQEQPSGTVALSGQGGSYPGFSTGISYLDDCTRYNWWVQPVISGVTSEHYIPSFFVTNFNGTCPGSPCDATTLVAPQPVSPEDRAIWTGTYPIISWDYAYPACTSGLIFHAQVARDEAFTSILVFSDNISGGWLTFDPAAATLVDCTTYYWRVAADSGGTMGPYSETRSFRTDFNGSCRRSATVDTNSACYHGPGSAYPLAAFLAAGDRVELLGRSENNIWIYINRPDGSGACWIDLLHLPDAGDISDLPAQFSPPLPTASPVPAGDSLNCSQYTSLFTCKSPCIWDPDPTHVGAGVCKNP